MKKLLLISSLLLFGSNGWAEECFQNDGDPIKLQGLLLEVTKYNTPLGTNKSYILRTEKKYCFEILGYKTPEGQEIPAREIDNTSKQWLPNESQRKAMRVEGEGKSYYFMPPGFFDDVPYKIKYEIMIGDAKFGKERRALFEKLSGQQVVLTFGNFFAEHTQWHLRRVVTWNLIKVELVN